MRSGLPPLALLALVLGCDRVPRLAPDGGPLDGPAPADARPALDGPASADAARLVDAAPGVDGAAGVDPATDGSYGVRSFDVTIPGVDSRQLAATVFAPSSDGGATIATGGAPYPLVVLSNGYGTQRGYYTSYGRHLATWGFIAISHDYPDPLLPDTTKGAAEISMIIDWAAAAGGPLAAVVDTTRVGTAGHSTGGKISFLAAAEDDRVRAVIGWDPVDAFLPSAVPERMAEVSVPAVMVGETLGGTGGVASCAPHDQNYQQFYDALVTTPVLEVSVAGADHMDWIDDQDCAVCGACPPKGTIDAAVVRAITRRVDGAWLRRHLLGDTSMDAWLLFADEVADGTVTLRAK